MTYYSFFSIFAQEQVIDPLDIERLISIFQSIFSIFILVPIAIASTGVFLGYVFSLEDGDNFMSIPVLFVLGIKVTGGKVIAGFTAFLISLFLVGYFLVEVAVKVFIENIQMTQS